MPFVNAKCPNCGGALQVDNGKRAALCPYCKEAYVVEDAINNYVTNNYTTIDHLHADVVNINSNPDFEIRGGELIKYNGAATDVIIPNNVRMIGGVFDDRTHRYYGAFQGCSLIRRVVIPEGVTSIGGKDGSIPQYAGGAFLGCSSLEEVVLPSTLTQIGECAFYECYSLRNIRFPQTLNRIANRAFERCSSLESITIPNGVSVGFCAFYACSRLKRVEVSDNVILQGSVFGSCSELESVLMGNNTTGTTYANSNSFEESNFNDTVWYNKQKEQQARIRQAEKEKHDALLKSRMKANQCLFCGGDFSLFTRTCKKCGKKKTY